MATNLKLQTAIHIALGVGAGAVAAVYAPYAAAQVGDQDTDETALEEVIVTGSRIRRADIASASPITVLDRDEIAATGMTDVGDIIQKMPSMSGSPIGTTTNNGGNGSVLIDLRGMGVVRTVTLVNGQRTVDGGDYQTIPSNMIERVEILKDGASAVYGADAVAGVVNIITRRDFEGVEVSLQTADWFDSQGKQDAISLIAGDTWDGGNFVFGAEFVNQEEAYQSDTPWEFFYDSYYIYPTGGCEVDPVNLCYPLGSSRIPESLLIFATQGAFMVGTPASQPYEVGLIAPFDGRLYNYAPVNYIQTPYERTNVFAEAHFRVSDNINFNVEFRANQRDSAQELAPVPYNSPTDPAHTGVFNGVAYSGIHQDNYYLRRAIDAYNAANGTSLVYEPVRDFRRRMIEGVRRFTQDITQYQFVAGFDGELENLDMNWEVFANYGYRERIDVDSGQFFGPNLFNALGPSADLDGDGQPECYGDINDPSTIIAGCVPLNAFGGGAVEPLTGQPTVTTVTQDMIDYLRIDPTDQFKTEHTIFGGSVAGSLFDLPGGELGWAAGYGYWKQDFRFTPDATKVTGTVTGNVGAGTEGQLTNDAVFLEVLAPLFDNGTQEVIVKAGVRYDDYDIFDGDTTWQLGIEFQTTESLKFRGTAGTVFRAPTISELFAGEADSFVTYEDPCARTPLPPGCERVAVQRDSQVRSRVGGNPGLIPETGDTYTTGVVWTPEFGEHGFTFTVDWWSIELEDGIDSLGAQFILDSCYVNLDPQACALITRGNDPDYSIARLLNTNLNVAEQTAEGVDTEIRWNYASGIGDWEAAFLWTHLLEAERTPFPGGDVEELDGLYTDPTTSFGGARPEDKINYSLQWSRGNLSLGYLGEYIGSMDTDAVFIPYTYNLDSELYHDLVASYEFGTDFGDLTFTGGITNFTDEPPPYIDLGFNAKTDPSTYRMFGIGYFLRGTWKF